MNTRVRLAIGLAITVLSLVLVAQVFELIPNANKPTMQARKLQTETLALTGNAIYESTGNIQAFETTLQNTLKRSENLRSIGLRDNDGHLTININNHQQKWQQPNDNRSNDKFMFVPIYHDRKVVAQLELCYEPLLSVKSWITSDVAKLAGFLTLASFFMFNILLWRILSKLDPSGPVPRRVRDALGILAEGLLVIDRKADISLANSTFGELVGIDAEDLTGKSANDFPWEVEKLPWDTAFEEGRTVKVSNMRIKDRNGVTRTFNVSASPVAGEKGRCRGAMVTFDDITVLEEHKQQLIKARKEADDANEAKSAFLSRMSHEIRTPMNAIIGYTDILRQGDSTTSDRQKFLGTIHSSGEHLLTIINDILDLSKIEAGEMTIENRRCRLVPIASSVVETLKIRAEQANLTLDMEIEGKVPAEILTDETRLRQVLINTVGNAIKFTKEGGVKLNVRLCGDRIEFDVIDTGVGIPAESLGKIFKPFGQADDSVTRKFGGTGLGLSISKQLSEAMGGGISVASQENVGTVFTISIDPGSLEDVQWITNEDAAREKVVNAEVVESRKFGSGHILIVDDGEANRDLAGVMLGRLGLTFDKAVNGQEALDKIAENQYDVVLMDINMPVMDGLTATKKLREMGSQIPIVALTAMAIEEEKQRCLNQGCSGFLPKPIRMNALIEMLSEYLELDNSVTDTIPLSKQGANAEFPAELTQILGSEGTDIESDLAKTLSDLGIEDDGWEEESPQAQSCGELVLPTKVLCSMPLDEPAIREIFESFVERLINRLPEFTAAWDANNHAELVSLSHWLAGAAATIGLDDFVAPARELEYSDWSDLQRAEEVLQHIFQLTDRIEMPTSVTI